MSNLATVTPINKANSDMSVKAGLEKGYDRLAHDITNTLALNPAKLSGCEYQIIFAIIGKTYRFQKKADWIANSQLCEFTGMSKNHVSKTIKSLIAKNIIIKNGKVIGLNNMVSEWKVNQSVNNENNKKLTNQCTEVNQSVSLVNQSVNKSNLITPPHKKETITKETITKDICTEPEVSTQQEDVFLKLPLNKNGTFYKVTETEVTDKIEIYSAVNVRQEYLAMLDWLNSNPTRRKTQSGIKGFVTRWLGKRQNNPSTSNPHSNKNTRSDLMEGVL